MELNKNKWLINDWVDSEKPSATGPYFEPPKEESWVYVIYNSVNKLTKIGITNHLKTRHRSLENSSGCELDVVIAIRLHSEYDEPSSFIEAFLHDFFKSKRKLGEWFSLSIKDIIQIRQLFWLIEGEDVKDNVKELTKKP